jgi:hypothetical protein
VQCERVVADLVIVRDARADVRLQAREAQIVEYALDQQNTFVVYPVYLSRNLCRTACPIAYDRIVFRAVVIILDPHVDELFELRHSIRAVTFGDPAQRAGVDILPVLNKELKQVVSTAKVPVKAAARNAKLAGYALHTYGFHASSDQRLPRKLEPIFPDPLYHAETMLFKYGGAAAVAKDAPLGVPFE